MANQQSIEISAETIEEAIQLGLIELGVQRTDVAIDIVEEGSLGVLGIGKKEAVVRLTLLDGDAPVETVEEEVVAAVEEEEVEEELGLDDVLEELSADSTLDVAVLPELEHEADIALEIVKTFIGKMGYDDATVKAVIGEKDDMDQRVVTVTVEGDGTDALIGEGGEVLNKVQFLARSMASQQLGDRTSFVVDVAGYRANRQAELVELAKETADKAINFRRPIALAPMPPHERRIIHMTLRNDERVETESKGEGDRRRVRVQPKGMRPRGGGNRRGGGRGRGGGGYRGGGGRGRGGGGGGGYRDRNDRRY